MGLQVNGFSWYWASKHKRLDNLENWRKHRLQYKLVNCYIHSLNFLSWSTVTLQSQVGSLSVVRKRGSVHFHKPTGSGTPPPPERLLTSEKEATSWLHRSDSVHANSVPGVKNVACCTRSFFLRAGDAIHLVLWEVGLGDSKTMVLYMHCCHNNFHLCIHCMTINLFTNYLLKKPDPGMLVFL